MSEGYRYLTPQEVAEKLNMTRQTASRLMESMPCTDVAIPGSLRKRKRIREDKLEQWLNARTNDRRRR